MRGSRWVQGERKDKVGKEDTQKTQLEPSQANFLRCPEHWAVCWGCFWTRSLFGYPHYLQKKPISLHCLQGESMEIRWLGWSWLLSVLLTGTQGFKRKGEDCTRRSFWGNGRSPKPLVLCNLLEHSLGCSWPFQIQMYFSEASYLVCVVALLLPFQKRWTHRLMKWASESGPQIPGKELQIPSTMASAWHIWLPGEQTRGTSTPCPLPKTGHGVMWIFGWCGIAVRFQFFGCRAFFDEMLKNEFPCAMWELKLLLHFPSELRLWPGVKTSLPLWHALCQ